MILPRQSIHQARQENQKASCSAIAELIANTGSIVKYLSLSENDRVMAVLPFFYSSGNMDEEGYLFMVSRKSDMIKSGSHRIAPKEIEEIILEHESVHEAAVVGQEDEILGETIKACVVLKPGAESSEKDLTRHCRKNLPPFKVPHQIVFLDELPKTATGKIKKADLK